MRSGQLAIEFMLSFAVYLSFILFLIYSLTYYLDAIKEKNSMISDFLEIEKNARIMDMHCIMDSGFIIKTGGKYFIDNGIVYSRETGVFSKTLYCPSKVKKYAE